MSEKKRSVSTPTTFKALSEMSACARGIVRQLRGGKEFTNRVAALGFTLGTQVVVVENYGRGPIIVGARDTRVALGRGEAAKMLVEVLHA